MLFNINIAAVISLVVYPITLIILGVFYHIHNGIGIFEILVMIFGYYGSNISVGIGLHRLWSHNSYKTNKFVEFILAVFSAGTLQGPALSWASNHYKHHTYTDTSKDPHTPLKYKNRFKGFLWSHIGWMLVGEGSYKFIDRVTMVKLGRNKILKWQLKHYWKIVLFTNLVLPMIIGYLIGGTIASAYSVFLFIGIGRAIQQQATFCVNSACHFMGSKQYYKGTAGDIWWLFVFLLGENWHNFHHAFPSDYRNGIKWYHCDVHKWIIFLMYKLGLAWNLNVTPTVRIEAKMHETTNYLIEGRRAQVNNVQDKIHDLVEYLRIKLNELDSCSSSIKKQFYKSLMDANSNLNNLKIQLQKSTNISESKTDKFIKTMLLRLQYIEKTINLTCSKLDKAIS
ncbi:MAG: acyl-CoA desaturase [Rickettsiaceae bacterium]